MTARRALVVCVILTAAGCGGNSGPESAAVAKWVTEMGGTVRLGDRNLALRKPADVPEGPLEIVEINLTDTKTTDKQLAEVAKLTHLDRLRLYGTDITDKGLQYLNGLDSLQELELSQTHITDKGLPTLAALKGLKKLYLYNTAVTKQGIEAFQKELPNTKIYASP